MPMRDPVNNPADVPATTTGATPLSTADRAVHFPYFYLALTFVSALDLILTYLVLVIGGMEVNPIANAVLQSPADFHGLILFKFLVVAAIILICEFIARHTDTAARRLAGWAVAISAFPVVWSTLLLSEQLF